jgi:hypothetical protein
MNDKTTSSRLFGKTREALLGLFYRQPSISYYTTQVIKAVQGGSGAIQRELNNLSEAGIIVREAHDRHVSYWANQNHPIFSELRSIVRKTFGMTEVIRGALLPVAEDIKIALLFYPISPNSDGREDDIELMVIGDIHFNDVVDQLGLTETELGREINTVVYPESTFKQKIRSDQNFENSIAGRDKIFLIGDDDELSKLVW